MRALVRETSLSSSDLVMPYFVAESDDENFAQAISSMPGQYQLSVKRLLEEVGKDVEAGLKACLLFGIPKDKDSTGSQAWSEDGIVQQAIREIKKAHPQLIVIADTCLCEYTDHGHCGLLAKNGEVLNDPTTELLAKTALAQAKAGADIIAPSDMMDGRVLAIREALDKKGLEHIPIMSYAVKYASAYYGPFREAAESAPQSGDRKAYQMDPANSREAMREAMADAAEGADFLIVKPAGPYQDIIRQVRDSFDIPVVAYQVSGEYSLICAAGEKGWVDQTSIMLESLIGLKRSGSDIIITYFTSEILRKKLI